MSEPKRVLEYSNLAGERKTRPVRHPIAIILSFSLYIFAVLIYALVELFAWLKWGSYGPGHVAMRAKEYGLYLTFFLLSLAGIFAAFIGLFQSPRKRWAALVALLLNLMGLLGVISAAES